MTCRTMIKYIYLSLCVTLSGCVGIIVTSVNDAYDDIYSAQYILKQPCRIERADAMLYIANYKASPILDPAADKILPAGQELRFYIAFFHSDWWQYSTLHYMVTELEGEIVAIDVTELLVTRDNPEVRPVFDEEYFEIIPNADILQPQLDEASRKAIWHSKSLK